MYLKKYIFYDMYLIQGEKIDTWFVFPASKKYCGTESTAFLSTNKFTKIFWLLTNRLYILEN